MYKIIFVNRYYWPDLSATSQLLTMLAEHLAKDMNIHVIVSNNLYSGEDCALSKNEILEGVNVHRVSGTNFGRAKLLGRAIDYLSFYVMSFFKMLQLVQANDVLIAKTDPPLISVLAALVVRIKNAHLINWVQDLFPEVASALNVRGLSSGPQYCVLKALRNWSLKIADINVVLGEIMAEKIESEIGQPEKTQIIPNWVIGENMKPVAKEDNFLVKEWGLADKFVLGYSGNLGRAHDYKTIFKAAEHFKDDEGIRFLIIGGGAGFELLRGLVEKAMLTNVIFKPYQAASNLRFSLSVPNFHIISLEPELEGLIVPSKFYGILAVGRPIFYLGVKDGEIGRFVQRDGLGRVFSTGDYVSFISEIEAFSAAQNKSTELGNNSRNTYELRFSADNSIRHWQQVLEVN